MEEYHGVVLLIVLLFEAEVLLLCFLEVAHDAVALGDLEGGALNLHAVGFQLLDALLVFVQRILVLTVAEQVVGRTQNGLRIRAANA